VRTDVKCSMDLLGTDHLIFDAGWVDFQFARYFFPPPDTVRFFFVSQRTCTIFFVCMYINFLVFCFYIFWYIIGIKLDKYWCKTLCSLNNERTSIQKWFFISLLRLLWWTLRKKLGKLRLYIETKVGEIIMGLHKRWGYKSERLKLSRKGIPTRVST
jgi:hypothetical protein